VTTAWLFPGQGAVEPRMGLALAACSEPAAALLEVASECVGRDVRKLLARGGPDLDRSEILQPVLTAVSLGAAATLLARGSKPALVAGHSLGELAAWSACGVIDARDAIRLAATRGQLMVDCAKQVPGGMIALVGSSQDDVATALDQGAREGMIVVAGHNAPDEWVLAGDEPSLRAVLSRVRCVRLRVEGPWHSPRMASAALRLREVASQLSTAPLSFPMVTGTTGQLVEGANEFARATGDLLVLPLKWVEVMATLRAQGVTEIVTCGPGKVLRSLIRRNLGADVRVVSTDHPAEMEVVCRRASA
jgi:[acyl-carrier-protein] S-malonyltransferase